VIPASVRKGLLERFTDGVVTLSEQEDSGDLLARQILAA
jgi:hypothetical protein